MTKKEEMFCRYFVNTGNIDQASVLSGFKNHDIAQKLISKIEILEKIKKLYKEKQEIMMIKTNIGYEHLAFGGINDAIKLIFSGNPSVDELNKMDFFNVSEIRRPREGAIEIKFFDRLKALEKLENVNLNFENKELPFYQALADGIKNFENSGSQQQFGDD
ncbi:MAG: terminase small subunit [Oscillospiraceae bacterium]|jgi:hypothetical protein|nr:terminase small subunit [Oscillospiraceae bacterium]